MTDPAVRQDETTVRDNEIELDEVRVEKGGVSILDSVSVTLTERRIAVIGANGSGKSTFARLLNGLTPASSGRVRAHGLNPARQGRELRRRVGFLFTNPDAQIVMPTVAEDVAFSLSGRGLTRDEIDERVAAVLAEQGLAALAQAPAQDLSGGQKQLLAFSAVLVTEPQLLVADEPTTLLDAANTRRISDLLMSLPQQAVIVTHNLQLAARCDVALLFAQGRLVEHGEPAGIIERYERELS